MSADEVAYWDREATTDPRYATAAWGMNGLDDGEETIDRILRILDGGMPPEDGYVVEIGCGPGRLLTRMADLYGDAEFYGLDISPAMLAIADRRIEEMGLKNIDVELVKGSQAQPADLVYCVELFQHLDDDGVRHYIAEALRMLKPGGMFIAQFVVRGEPGPHSYPRERQQISTMFNLNWSTIGFCELPVHEDWTWVMAIKA